MNIPELSINPLAQRLERVFESVNFKVDSVEPAPSVCLLACKFLLDFRNLFISCQHSAAGRPWMIKCT